MIKFIFISIALYSSFTHASVSGMLSINSDNTIAKLLINETQEDGKLSQLFDQMKLNVTTSGFVKSKEMLLSNGRFGFKCNKSSPPPSTLPSTSCVFIITHGENSGELKTFISKESMAKIATISMTSTFSREFEGVFPDADTTGLSFLLNLSNGVTFEVKGASYGNMAIGLSMR